MGMKFAKDAVKIGFADIAIQQGTPSQPFFGYFADSEMSVEQRTALAYKLGAEESCFKEPVYVDDTCTCPDKSNCQCGANSTDPIPESMPLPTNEQLTTPPNTAQLLDNPYVQAGILGVGVYLFIKLVS